MPHSHIRDHWSTTNWIRRQIMLFHPVEILIYVYTSIYIVHVQYIYRDVFTSYHACIYKYSYMYIHPHIMYIIYWYICTMHISSIHTSTNPYVHVHLHVQLSTNLHVYVHVLYIPLQSITHLIYTIHIIILLITLSVVLTGFTSSIILDLAMMAGSMNKTYWQW